MLAAAGQPWGFVGGCGGPAVSNLHHYELVPLTWGVLSLCIARTNNCPTCEAVGGCAGWPSQGPSLHEGGLTVNMIVNIYLIYRLLQMLVTLDDGCLDSGR